VASNQLIDRTPEFYSRFCSANPAAAGLPPFRYARFFIAVLVARFVAAAASPE
jgi:hypothetical protein